MTKTYIKTAFLLLLSFFFQQCSNNSHPPSLKVHPNDPFKNTMTPSEFFEVDSKMDNVVQGQNGTFLVLPKGCFLDDKGQVVTDKVNIELSEALSMDEMLLSNLTTMSNGKLLQTDGMIYFNATADGKQLLINKDKPVHIEIPTWNKVPGMMAYKGVRDSLGNMNWVEPKALDNYLHTVDIDLLDFLPRGFRAVVETGMPFKNHTVATEELADSLYYSLSASDRSSLVNGFTATNLNEPYYNKSKKVVNGQYTTESFRVNTDTMHSLHDTSVSNGCGIDPARIKLIKSTMYQHTLIATREFEARLQAIYESCDNAVLDLYSKNPDKNLWELDSMAAAWCDAQGKHNAFHAFYDFAALRLTRVKDADQNAALLKEYYDTQLRKIKSELKQQQEKMARSLDEKNAAAYKVGQDYAKLLMKREKFRMETYGFNWTETGWINIDTGTVDKDWGSFPLEITIDNGKDFDRVYTYVIYQSIKSLYRLNTTDNQQFYAGNDQEKEMLMPKTEIATAIAIGYKGETPSVAVREFLTSDADAFNRNTGSAMAGNKFSMTLQASTPEKVKGLIMKYDQKRVENKISEDLAFMTKFYNEELRQKELRKESEFLQHLHDIAFRCCQESDEAAVQDSIISAEMRR